MQIAVLLIQDRHSDPGVELFQDPAAAIARADELVIEYGEYNHTTAEEQAEYDKTNVLNNDMQRDGWIHYRVYSCESDSVRVMIREVK